MAIGAVDSGAGSEAVVTAYGFQMDLSTSFTGEDTLAVAIDAGDGGNVGQALEELDLNETGDVLTVDGVSYTFPVGDKLTVLVGDSTSGSALYSTACVYGGFTNTLDDCGNFSSAFVATGHADSVGFSASYDIGGGFTGAIGYQGQGTANAGLATDAGVDFYGGQLTYTGDSYGASVTYANLDAGTAWGLNGYYTFASNLPSVSVGYEFTEAEVPNAADLEFTQWFVGLQWDEIGPGTLGIALGTDGPQQEDTEENMAYELFYTYNVNDGMTITPAIFIVENNAEGQDDQTGVVVKTSFSF
ncbi:porin [Prochlorococcus marinus str. XMU1419]|nr:porin [Prochlorococcus marinus str. XMU1419]